MKFYKTKEIPSLKEGTEIIVSERLVSRIFNTLVFIFILLSSTGGIAVIVHTWNDAAMRAKIGMVPLCFGLFFCLILILISISSISIILRSGNWQVRLRPEEMLIKFRSDANARLPEPHPVVLSLPYYDISWARKTAEWIELYGLNLEENAEKRPAMFLELKLNMHKDKLDLIKKAIDKEIAYCHAEGSKADVSVHHFPVRMTGDVLRIEWLGGGKFSCTKPGLDEIMHFLQRRTLVELELELSVDYTEIKDEDDAYRKIKELVGRGNEISAIGIARRFHNLSISEAKELVDKIKRDHFNSS